MRTRTTSWPAAISQSAGRAPGSTSSAASSTTTHGLRFNNYLFAQQTIVWRRLSVLAGVGYVNNSSFGGKVSPRASVTFLALRGNTVFSGTRLHFGYSQGIKEPSFEQTFGITGTFPTL